MAKGAHASAKEGMTANSENTSVKTSGKSKIDCSPTTSGELRANGCADCRQNLQNLITQNNKYAEKESKLTMANIKISQLEAKERTYEKVNVSLKQREEALLAKESLLTNIEQALKEAKPTHEIYDRLADKLQVDFNKMIQESRENIKADELARELKFNKNWSKAYDKIVSSQERAYSDRMAKHSKQIKRRSKRSKRLGYLRKPISKHGLRLSKERLNE